MMLYIVGLWCYGRWCPVHAQLHELATVEPLRSCLLYVLDTIRCLMMSVAEGLRTPSLSRVSTMLIVSFVRSQRDPRSHTSMMISHALDV